MVHKLDYSLVYGQQFIRRKSESGGRAGDAAWAAEAADARGDYPGGI